MVKTKSAISSEILNASIKKRLVFSQLVFDGVSNLDRGVILPHRVYCDKGMTERSAYAKNLIT